MFFKSFLAIFLVVILFVQVPKAHAGGAGTILEDGLIGACIGAGVGLTIGLIQKANKKPYIPNDTSHVFVPADTVKAAH